MSHDLVHLRNALGDIVREFADESSHKNAQSRYQILLIFRPVADTFQNRLAQKLVIWLELTWICNESRVELKGISCEIGHILFDDQIESGRQMILNTGERI